MAELNLKKGWFRGLLGCFLAAMMLLPMAGCGVVLMEPIIVDSGGDVGFDGSVIDIETGAAISNARVRVTWLKNSDAYFESFTDVQGKFSIRYLRQGNEQLTFQKGERYQFTVSSSEYRTFRRPETFKGKIQDLEIGLAKFEDNQRKPESPVPPSPDKAIEPYYRAGPPIP